MNIIRGDALHLPLRSESVDLIITSPPYFGLRDYSTGHPAELGSEPHWRDFIRALILATAEMVRVLKPSGSIFINLGDKYAGGATGALGISGSKTAYVRDNYRDTTGLGIREKSLMLLPERYRIACVDQLGLTARAVIIWDKPNGLPESVRDRVRRSHEDWVHLTRGPRYYAALDEIREPHAAPLHAPGNNKWPGERNDGDRMAAIWGNPLGKLPGSVWTIPSEPLRLPPWIDTQHYAAFSSEWPRRLILAFSPPGICVVCKVGRYPVVDVDRRVDRRLDGERSKSGATGLAPHGGYRGEVSHTILGYACGCTPHTDHPATGGSSQQDVPRQDGADRQAVKIREVSGNNRPGLIELHDYQRVGPWREYHLAGWTPPPTTPAIILDPFGGTGTVAHVATALGRTGISIDLSHAYSLVAADRTLARQRAGKVLGRVHLERQGTLL